jgi:hypothetical protein
MTTIAKVGPTFASVLLVSSLILSGCNSVGGSSKAPAATGPVVFKTERSSNALQCTPQNVSGKWQRYFPPEYAHRGSAVWTFSSNGKISCKGSGCKGKHTQGPKSYEVSPVSIGSPYQNIGLHVKLAAGSSTATMRTTCEIVDKTMYFGNGADDKGLTFNKL